MTDWVYNLDKAISNMGYHCRIIYFKSENRHIIEDAVNHSSALQAKLGKGAADNLYRNLIDRKECIELPRIYQKAGVSGMIKESGESPVAVTLTDFQVYSESDRNGMVKAFLDSKYLHHTILLISSPQILIPDGFSNEIEIISDMYISKNDIYQKLAKQVRKEEADRGEKFFSDQELKKFTEEFVGLSVEQIDTILDSIRDELCTGLREGRHKDFIRQERLKEAAKDAAIKFIELEKKESVAGLGHYSVWLSKREKDFADPILARKNGTPSPKGVLLCGVPGTGKTAMARETARVLHVPLIQFDISRIQDSKFGASEIRLRRYLDRISAFGSCVMLMDEIEKTFSVNDSTHEVKLAMLGLLLDWMQYRTANIFTFITANNISKLPPELLRDGRISGRFFAFMPSRDDLAAIMRLKLSPLVETDILDQEFRSVIREKANENKGQGDGISKLARILDLIAEDAREMGKEGTIRWPFMTGANMETLIEMTNRELREDQNVKLPYNIETYAKQMRKCAASADFIPQGQSNMDDIVNMWIKAQKYQYQDVSVHTLLPFSAFKDGKFTKELHTGNPYDGFMVEVLKEEIEKACEKANEKEAVFHKIASEKQK